MPTSQRQPAATPPDIPDEYREHFNRHADTIRERLAEFRAVPADEYLWELLYCLLTPQSRALHAEQVIAKLRRDDFLKARFDPTPYLRDPAHYIRFHNQKGLRLLDVAGRGEEIRRVLVSEKLSSAAKREWLVEHVKGLGWKEASHFLRNIGHLDLAIIDRHILKHMLRARAITELPKNIGTRRTYLDLEEKFRKLAERAGMELQELDLLFWSYEEGSVRK
jgi:N-glycosylase/DNA lyase